MILLCKQKTRVTLWNFSETDSLLFVADDLGKSRILDVNAPFKIGKPFTYNEMCCYNCPKTGFDTKIKRVANGTWWRTLESKRLPNVEGRSKKFVKIFKKPLIYKINFLNFSQSFITTKANKSFTP